MDKALDGLAASLGTLKDNPYLPDSLKRKITGTETPLFTSDEDRADSTLDRRSWAEKTANSVAQRQVGLPDIALAAGGLLTGNKEFAADRLKRYNENEALATRMGPEVQEFGQVEDAAGAASALGYGAAKMVPDLVVAAITGGVGGALVKQGLKGVAEKAITKKLMSKGGADLIEEQAKKNVAGLATSAAYTGADAAAKTALEKGAKIQAAEQITKGLTARAAAIAAKKGGSNAAVTAAQIGSMSVGSLPSMLQDQSQFMTDNIDNITEGDAAKLIAGSMTAGALQYLPFARLAGRFGAKGVVERVAKDKFLKRLAKSTGDQFLAEGSEEAGQAFITRGSQKWVDNNIDMFDNAALQDYAANFLAGGILGGVMGGSAEVGTTGARKIGELFAPGSQKRAEFVDKIKAGYDKSAQAFNNVKNKAAEYVPDGVKAAASSSMEAAESVAKSAGRTINPLYEKVKSAVGDTFESKNRASAVRDEQAERIVDSYFNGTTNELFASEHDLSGKTPDRLGDQFAAPLFNGMPRDDVNSVVSSPEAQAGLAAFSKLMRVGRDSDTWADTDETALQNFQSMLPDPSKVDMFSAWRSANPTLNQAVIESIDKMYADAENDADYDLASAGARTEAVAAEPSVDDEAPPAWHEDGGQANDQNGLMSDGVMGGTTRSALKNENTLDERINGVVRAIKGINPVNAFGGTRLFVPNAGPTTGTGDRSEERSRAAIASLLTPPADLDAPNTTALNVGTLLNSVQLGTAPNATSAEKAKAKKATLALNALVAKREKQIFPAEDAPSAQDIAIGKAAQRAELVQEGVALTEELGKDINKPTFIFRQSNNAASKAENEKRLTGPNKAGYARMKGSDNLYDIGSWITYHATRNNEGNPGPENSNRALSALAVLMTQKGNKVDWDSVHWGEVIKTGKGTTYRLPTKAEVVGSRKKAMTMHGPFNKASVVQGRRKMGRMSLNEAITTESDNENDVEMVETPGEIRQAYANTPAGSSSHQFDDANSPDKHQKAISKLFAKVRDAHKTRTELDNAGLLKPLSAVAKYLKVDVEDISSINPKMNGKVPVDGAFVVFVKGDKIPKTLPKALAEKYPVLTEAPAPYINKYGGYYATKIGKSPTEAYNDVVEYARQLLIDKADLIKYERNRNIRINFLNSSKAKPEIFKAMKDIRSGSFDASGLRIRETAQLDNQTAAKKGERDNDDPTPLSGAILNEIAAERKKTAPVALRKAKLNQIVRDAKNAESLETRRASGDAAIPRVSNAVTPAIEPTPAELKAERIAERKRKNAVPAPTSKNAAEQRAYDRMRTTKQESPVPISPVSEYEKDNIDAAQSTAMQAAKNLAVGGYAKRKAWLENLGLKAANFRVGTGQRNPLPKPRSIPFAKGAKGPENNDAELIAHINKEIRSKDNKGEKGEIADFLVDAIRDYALILRADIIKGRNQKATGKSIEETREADNKPKPKNVATGKPNAKIADSAVIEPVTVPKGTTDTIARAATAKEKAARIKSTKIEQNFAKQKAKQRPTGVRTAAEGRRLDAIVAAEKKKLVRKQAVKDFGEDVIAPLEAAGLLQVTDTKGIEELAPELKGIRVGALGNPETGVIAINADEATDAEISSTMLHESVHTFVKNLIGEAAFSRIMNDIAFRDGGLAESENASDWHAEAARRVSSMLNKATAQGKDGVQMADEIAAYGVTEFENLPNSLKKRIAIFVGKLRAALARWMIKHNVAPKLQSRVLDNPAALRALAMSAIKHTADAAKNGKVTFEPDHLGKFTNFDKIGTKVSNAARFASYSTFHRASSATAAEAQARGAADIASPRNANRTPGDNILFLPTNFNERFAAADDAGKIELFKEFERNKDADFDHFMDMALTNKQRAALLAYAESAEVVEMFKKEAPDVYAKMISNKRGGENSLRYLYEAYAAGRLKDAPTEQLASMRRMSDKAKDFMGVYTQEDEALQILKNMTDGVLDEAYRFNKPYQPDKDVRKNQKILGKIKDAVEDATENMRTNLANILYSDYTRAYESGSVAFIEIANKLQARSGTRLHIDEETGVADRGYFPAVSHETGRWIRKLQSTVRGLSVASQQKVVRELYRQNKNPRDGVLDEAETKAFHNVRKVFKEAAEYSVRTGVLTEDQIRNDYMPLIFDKGGNVEAHKYVLNKILSGRRPRNDEDRAYYKEKIDRRFVATVKQLERIHDPRTSPEYNDKLTELKAKYDRALAKINDPKATELKYKDMVKAIWMSRQPEKGNKTTDRNVLSDDFDKMYLDRDQLALHIKDLADGAFFDTADLMFDNQLGKKFKHGNYRIFDDIFKQAKKEKNQEDLDALVSTLEPSLEQHGSEYFENMVARGEFNIRDNFDELISRMVKEGTSPADVTAARRMVDAARLQYNFPVLEGDPEKGTARRGSPTIALFSESLALKMHNRKTLTAMQNIGAYQNLRLLPLALLSSLVDPQGIMVRNGGDVGNTFAAIKDGVRGVWDKDTRDALIAAAEEVEYFADLNASQALHEGFGAGQNTPWSRKINNAVFKWNGLEGWTRMTRLMGVQAGHSFLVRQQNLARTGTDAQKESAKRYFEELGLKPDDVREGTVASGPLKGRLYALILNEQQFAVASKEEQQRDTRVRNAIVQFTDEALLRPNNMQTPTWHKDPYVRLITQYKAFSYAIYEQITRRFKIELAHGNYRVLYAAMGYLPVVALAEFIREMLQWGPEGNPQRNQWGAAEYTRMWAMKTGLAGPQADLFATTNSDISRGNVPASSALGPTFNHADQLIDTARGQRSYGGTVRDSLPLAGLHRNWGRDSVGSSEGDLRRKTADKNEAILQ